MEAWAQWANDERRLDDRDACLLLIIITYVSRFAKDMHKARSKFCKDDTQEM